MSNGLIDLEDEMYRLYTVFYQNGKAVRIGLDALSLHHQLHPQIPGSDGSPSGE